MATWNRPKRRDGARGATGLPDAALTARDQAAGAEGSVFTQRVLRLSTRAAPAPGLSMY